MIVFTEQELSDIEKFQLEHLNCNRKPNSKSSITGFTIHEGWGTGIGVTTYITCDCCGETKDITDYDSW